MLINICQAMNWLNAPHFPSLVCGNAQEIVKEQSKFVEAQKTEANKRLSIIFT